MSQDWRLATADCFMAENASREEVAANAPRPLPTFKTNRRGKQKWKFQCLLLGSWTSAVDPKLPVANVRYLELYQRSARNFAVAGVILTCGEVSK